MPPLWKKSGSRAWSDLEAGLKAEKAGLRDGGAGLQGEEAGLKAEEVGLKAEEDHRGAFFSSCQPEGEVLSTAGKSTACSQRMEQDSRNAAHQHREQQLGRISTRVFLKPANS